MAVFDMSVFATSLFINIINTSAITAMSEVHCKGYLRWRCRAENESATAILLPAAAVIRPRHAAR